MPISGAAGNDSCRSPLFSAIPNVSGVPFVRCVAYNGTKPFGKEIHSKMELIVISDTKLKVVLTEEEMEHYGLVTGEDGDPSREAVERLLSEIRRLSGFDAVGMRVLVQLWKDRSGGGEMYVTRLTERDDDGRKEYSMRRSKVLYAFDAMDPLTAACRILVRRDFCGTSDAYRGDDGVWYLSIENTAYGEEPGILDILTEYGVQRSGAVLTVLPEHAQLIVHGTAVEALASIAR